MINNQDSNEHSSLRQEYGLIKMLPKWCQQNEWDNHITNHLSEANGPLSEVSNMFSGSGNPQPANHQSSRSIIRCQLFSLFFLSNLHWQQDTEVGGLLYNHSCVLMHRAMSLRAGALQKARRRGQFGGCLSPSPSKSSVYQNYHELLHLLMS